MQDEKLDQLFWHPDSYVCDASESKDVRDYFRAHFEGCEAGKLLFNELDLCEDIEQSVRLMYAVLQTKLIEPAMKSCPDITHLRLLGFSLGFSQAKKNAQQFAAEDCPWKEHDD